MSTCKSCGAEIIWAVTANGSRMPMDATPEPRRRGLFTLTATGPVSLLADTFTDDDPPLHRSHFATCPNADQHRKRKSQFPQPAMQEIGRSADDPIREGNGGTDLESPTAKRERLYHEAVDAE